MKIAIILPAIDIGGPQNLINALVNEFLSLKHEVKIFYFDDKTGTQFNCATERISFWDYQKLSQFDVIHTHGIRPDLFGFIHKGKWKAKLVTTIHSYLKDDLGFLYGKLGGLFFLYVWNFILLRHHKIVLLSKHMQAYYQSIFWNKKQSYVYNCTTLNNEYIPDLSTEVLQKLTELQAKYKVLGSICYMLKRKGLTQIIDLLAANKQLAYLAIGDGPFLQELKNYAEKKGVADRCVFAGFYRNPYHLMKHFDVFIQPSYSEGFPIAVIEAGLMAKPTICSNLPIYDELFTSDELLTFPLNNTSALEAQVLKIGSNPQFYAENLSNKVKNNYMPAHAAQKYLAIYSE